MLRKTSLLLSLAFLTACASKEKPFIATAVPADFSIVVDENHDTYYARQHIQQVISASDSMSRTTYTTFRDYNNTVSDQFSQETPLSDVQLQNMWNDVQRDNLLAGSQIWINWLSDSDLYKHNRYTVQIRANGKIRSYRSTNSFAAALRPLILQANAVRLPITQNSRTPVVGAPQSPAMEAATQPTTEPVTTPATEPASQPTTIPSMNP
ncbi:MAG TPA: hypothetical protein VM008_00020 [Phycisphaerae bacterium]|nr:hypothetical protein [Phycisphaerae bacterium]